MLRSSAVFAGALHRSSRALGELVPLERDDLVAEVLDHCLIAVDLLAHCVDLRQQLRDQCAQLVRCQLVEIWRDWAVNGDQPMG